MLKKIYMQMFFKDITHKYLSSLLLFPLFVHSPCKIKATYIHLNEADLLFSSIPFKIEN